MSGDGKTTYELANALSRLSRYRDATRGALANRIGFRGASLLFFSLYQAVYSFSLYTAPPPLSPGLTFVASLAPLWVWGSLWAAASLAALVDAFRERDQIGFTATIAVQLLWFMLYVGLALVGIGGARAYVGAVTWLALSAFVAIISAWPEPRRR